MIKMPVLAFLLQKLPLRYVYLTFGEIRIITATRFQKSVFVYALKLRTFVIILLHNTSLLYLPF